MLRFLAEIISLRYVQAAHEQENFEATFEMGEILMDGEGGTPVEMHKAINLWEEAASSGHTEAEFRVGLLCLRKEDEDDLVKGGKDFGVRLLARASEKGHAKAAYALAKCYFEGEGIQKDVTKGAELFRTAVMSGILDANAELGNCYAKVWCRMRRAQELQLFLLHLLMALLACFVWT